MITRTAWSELPDGVRTAVQAHTGTIQRVHPVQSGLNSGIAATLHTRACPVFIKGIPTDHPQARTQQREADINPYVHPVAPRLLWRVIADGWDILGFEHVNGRPADLSPKSPDLPKIAEALGRLHDVEAAGLTLRRIEDRWADHLPAGAGRLLHGDHVLHTDLNPNNILITATSAKILDWAWPTRGAAWIDPACLALWLIHAGHTPRDAEEWFRPLPNCVGLTKAALDAFMTIHSGLWSRIAAEDPSRWKQELATVARHMYRSASGH